MDYKIMEPPFGSKSFNAMSKTEAKIHFDWYMGIINERLKLLNMAFRLDNVKNKLDFTDDSIVLLWEWYINNVGVSSKPTNEYEVRNLPDYMKVNVPREKIHVGWIQIALDIGIYLSELLLKQSSDLHWDCIIKPQDLDCLNRPVIVGFKNNMTFDHMRIMSTATSKILSNRESKEDLINLINVWRTFIPNLK